MPRWSQYEKEQLEKVRGRLGHLFDNAPPFPEVVGDRKILRFLRGHDYNIDKVCDMITKFLLWRKEKSVDDIRQSIVIGTVNCPSKFPKGELILKLIPQIVIAPEAVDKLGCPICVEKYDFIPSEVLEQLTIDEYILFLIHALEYKSLVMEQLSEQAEQKYLASLSDEERKKQLREDDEALQDTSLQPYGVIAGLCVIRDLHGLGFAHVGSKGQEIIRAVASVAQDNYPELMRKCYMINTPWIFNALWYFVKGLLAARTIAKVSLLGTGYMIEISANIDLENLPALVGGQNAVDIDNKPFVFDEKYFCPPGFGRAAVTPNVASVVTTATPPPEVSSLDSAAATLLMSTAVNTSPTPGTGKTSETIAPVPDTVFRVLETSTSRSTRGDDSNTAEASDSVATVASVSESSSGSSAASYVVDNTATTTTSKADSNTTTTGAADAEVDVVIAAAAVASVSISSVAATVTEKQAV